MNFTQERTPGFNPIQNAHEAVAEHMQEITSLVANDIRDEFPDKDEARIAEIALAVCSRLLHAHFSKRAAKGFEPLDR